jgi:hypothetical protein
MIARSARERIGALLHETALPLGAIAQEMGVSYSTVRVIQQVYFPDSPRRPTGRPQGSPDARPRKPSLGPERLARRERVGWLLTKTDLTLAAIAREVGLSKEQVRQLQKRHFPECSRRRRTGKLLTIEDGHADIQVEITDASEFHCFRLTLNPSSATGQQIEIMLHARALVELIHQCSSALCDWQATASSRLIQQITGLDEAEAGQEGLIG